MTSNNPDRRAFLWSLGGGLGGIALAHLLGQQDLLAADAPKPQPTSTAASIIAPRRSASCSSSCPARPASATRSTTSRR